MSTALAKAGRLKPEVRLGQAISEFQADLPLDQKARFQSSQSNSITSPPNLRDVMRLTAEMNRCGNQDRCFGPRMTSFLQAVQGFASLGDIVLGGTQNLLASGVWAVVRLTLLSIVKYSSYFERLSLVLMDVGRSAPRYQAMGAIYPESNALRSSMLEYFIVVVQLFHHVVRLSHKSAIGKWASTLSEASLSGYRSDLERWAKSVKEEVNLAMAEQLALATQERTWFRSHIMRRNESDIHAQKVRAKQNILDACSTYNMETAWKQIRKSGNVTLLRESTTYASWKDRDESCTLLCTGRLGSGKSVLLANVVEDIAFLDHKTAITYFFCQHEVAESLTAPVIIGSLVRQLLQPLLADPESVSEQLPDHRPLRIEEMLRLLERVLPHDHRAYFILDGLGHCEPEEQRVVINALKPLQDKYTIALCVSIRLDPVDVPQRLITQLHKYTVLTMPKQNPDIERFVNAELQRCIESERLVLQDPLLILEIEERLCQGAQGMFLWVALQIKALCLERSDADIRQSLGNLPTSLSEIYSAILVKAQAADTKYQLKLFEIVMVARRPLNTEEMREALSVVPGNTNWDPQRLPNDIYSTVGCCAGLLAIDEEDLSIHMVHHSVRTFLLNDYRSVEAFSVERAHERMDNIVLTFLNYEVFSKQITSSKALKISAGAVASSTLSSTTKILGSNQAHKLALKLLRVNGKADRDIGPALANLIGDFRESRVLTPLEFHNYAVNWWPQHIWHLDLSHGVTHRNFYRLLGLVDLQTTDACGRTPLSYAAELGKVGIVWYLLDHGALDTPDTNGNTPLIWAVKAGHFDVVEVLLKSRIANLTMRDSFGRTPLTLVLAAGNDFNARLLVNQLPFQKKYVDHIGVPPIIHAARKNYWEGVKLLLDIIMINLLTSLDPDRNTVLHFAAAFGNIEIINILLEAYAADANALNTEQKTPLWMAASNGHDKVFAQLLVYSTDFLHHPSLDGSTPLWIAAKHGHIGIVRAILPPSKAAFGTRNMNNLSPALWIAAAEGHEIIVGLILPRVVMLADIEFAYWLATSNGHNKISSLLSHYLQEEGWNGNIFVLDDPNDRLYSVEVSNGLDIHW